MYARAYCHNTRAKARQLLLLLFALGGAPLASALNYCVGTSFELDSALTAASASAADDEIQLQAGSYALRSIGSLVNGALTMRGGFPVGCSGFGSLSAQSTITNASAEQFTLSGNADLILNRVNFSGWREVFLGDAQSAVGSAGELRVSRCRFNNSINGLQISARRFNVRVENSIFYGYSNSGLLITGRATGPEGQLGLIQFNTLVNSTGSVGTTKGLEVSVNGPFSRMHAVNNVINGNERDIKFVGQMVRMQNNFWNTELFQIGGGLSSGSSANLFGNPGLTASPAFQPIVPSSPLINSGLSTGGDMPSFDFSGDQRLTGTRPDLGAFETSVDNSSSIVVTSNADSGSGSLRSAITSANTNPGFKKITFNIPGTCPQRIILSSALPAITQSVGIEGYTQPGSVLNTQGVSFDGTVCVFVTGGNAIGSGLRLQTQSVDDEMVVRGLGFYGFSSQALLISGPGKGSVRGNLFATGLGLPGLGQNFSDAVIRVQDAPGTVIGTIENADMNVIGGGDVVGVDLQASAVGGRFVDGNLIGINSNGTTGLPNGIGVRIADSDSDSIRKNLLSFNTSHALTIGGTATNALVLSNYIGYSSNNSASGNGGNAVRILAGSGHRVRNNRIYRSASDGIVVLSTARANKLELNYFDGAQNQAIDLAPDGVNPIDLDVGQTGANDQQNYPLITDAMGSTAQGEVALNFSSANGTYSIELYANPNCAASAGGFSQAQAFLHAATGIVLDCATAVSNCSKQLLIPVTNRFLVGDLQTGNGITAIATDEEGNTSEVSACRMYRLGGNLFKDGFE